MPTSSRILAPITGPCPNPFGAFLADLAEIGVYSASEGGITYGLLRARSNARWWLVPLGSSAHAVGGLAMFQPMSRAAHVAKLGAMALMRAGLDGLWARDRLRLSGLPRLDCCFGAPVHACAYFTGTAGPHRKTVIQFMDHAGCILGYGKVSRTPAVIACLRNEARVLRKLAGLSLAQNSVPRCLELSEEAGRSVLVTDSVKAGRPRSPKTLDARHLAFVRELASRTGGADAGRTLADLRGRVETACVRMPPEWVTRFQDGFRRIEPLAPIIPTCLAHGDFTPWNCFLQDGRLFVFDWEYAHEHWPVGHDIACFRIAAAYPHIPADFDDMLVNEIARHFMAGDRKIARGALLLSLLLHSMFYIERSLDFGKAVADWEWGTAHACLVDRVLAKWPENTRN